jgi:flavodoxin I
MEKIGLFFGPTGGNCNNVANKIIKKIGEENIDIYPVKGLNHTTVEKYDKIIFGISSLGRDAWNNEDYKKDWDEFLPEFFKIDFTGKKVAAFGLGNQILYPEHFAESLGFLARELKNKGVELVAGFPNEGFEFKESTALNESGDFYGLVVDEDNEPEKTDERIDKWLPELKKQFNL